jgi:hypothetical protein
MTPPFEHDEPYDGIFTTGVLRKSEKSREIQQKIGMMLTFVIMSDGLCLGFRVHIQ